MTNIERIHKIDSVFLIIAGIVDLLFGILSLIFVGREWQICSALASIASLALIIRLIIAFPKDTKRNVSSLVIGSLDVIAGTLSVFLAIYGIKALAMATASITAFNSIKIAIQSQKMVKLSKTLKPVGTKIVAKFAPLLLVSTINKIKRGIEKMKNEKVTIVKANKMTIGFSSIIAVFSALIGWGADFVLPIVAPTLSGVWYYVTLVAIAVLAFIILETVIVLLGKDSKASYTVSTLAKQIGLEVALEKLNTLNEQMTAENAEKERQLQEQAEREYNMLANNYKVLVANNGYDKSFEEYIFEINAQKEAELAEKAKREAELEEQNLKTQWKNEIVAEKTTLSYKDWKASLSK